jgi:hypothetical protein
MVSMTGLQINSYDVLTETHDSVYSSDHNPIVMATVPEQKERPHPRVWTLVISDGF